MSVPISQVMDAELLRRAYERVAHEDEDAPGVQRGDVLLGGRRLEPGVDEHLLEVAVRGDADVGDAVLVARDRLAGDVPEAAAARLGGAGERARGASFAGERAGRAAHAREGALG